MLPAQVELHAWLAQLAVYGADWERVETSTEASAKLAEREGLVGKLCLPYALRGILRWREAASTGRPSSSTARSSSPSRSAGPSSPSRR